MNRVDDDEQVRYHQERLADAKGRVLEYEAELIEAARHFTYGSWYDDAAESKLNRAVHRLDGEREHVRHCQDVLGNAVLEALKDGAMP